MKTRVLLVDDEADFTDPLSERLTLRGFDVQSVSSGKAALKIIQQESFDVVLLDIVMPEQSGLDVLRKIVDIDPLLHVILLTGHAEIDTAIEEIRGQAFDFLIKPVPIDELVERIQMAHQNRTLAEQKNRYS